MGNNVSKRTGGKGRRTKSMPPPARVQQPAQQQQQPEDNEYSTNTTQSVNSILLNSQHRRSTPAASNSSALTQLNPEYPTGGGGDNKQYPNALDSPVVEEPKHPQPHQHKHLSQADYWPQQDNDRSQLTVGSLNQLTATSMASYNTKSVTAAEIDEYIQRLLNAGYAKPSKQLCLKNSEVAAICYAAMDIFLSQPVRFMHIAHRTPARAHALKQIFFLVVVARVIASRQDCWRHPWPVHRSNPAF